MPYRADIHHRRSIRLRGHDYRLPGAYFITVCTHGREPLFGRLVAGEMQRNAAGHLLQRFWDEIPVHFPQTALDEFIIMPDHIHGIVHIRMPDAASDTGNEGAASRAPTLGIIMRRFKSCSAIALNRLTGRAGRPLWQRDYWERIIRHDDELRAIRRYIRNNPMYATPHD